MQDSATLVVSVLCAVCISYHIPAPRARKQNLPGSLPCCRKPCCLWLTAARLCLARGIIQWYYSMASASPRTAPVCIPYESLLDQNADLSRELCAGFGPNGLGIVTVSGVPDFVERREELLPLAQAFAVRACRRASQCPCCDEQTHFFHRTLSSRLSNPHLPAAQTIRTCLMK